MDPLFDSVVSETYKYTTRNPGVRWLMGRFTVRVLEHVKAVSPRSILDIGCGEGVITKLIGDMNPEVFVAGADIDKKLLIRHSRHNVKNLVANEMPFHCFRPGAFDLVIMTEVLEHLYTPSAAIKAIHRITREHALITVPHEPIWRIENMLRLKYLRDWGNTPGHVQHFSRKSLKGLLEDFFSEVQVGTSFPWLIAKCRK